MNGNEDPVKDENGHNLSTMLPDSDTNGPATPNIPFDDEPDFELIDAVEWAPEDDSQQQQQQQQQQDGSLVDFELAVRPKMDKNDDPCGCTRPSDPTVMTCNDLSCVLFACQEECRSNCWAGDQCGNRRIQRKQWKQLQIFDAGKKGKGLRVLEDVRAGDFVTEYVGRAVNKQALPTLFRRYERERKLYIMALDTNIYIDARKKGGIARYINHSCDPNCVVERWKVRGILRAAVVACKDIPAGTELSFDYQWERKRGRAPTKCHCGSIICRGTLEVPRSMEEEALERKLSNHWKKPLIKRAKKEILNRCIRVFSKETQDYFVADVTSFDENTGKHLVMYRHDLEEVWEDLCKEDWMILDEGAEQFIIRKKAIPAPGALPQSLLGVPPALLLQGQVAQNYIYVQTHIKEAMINKHLLERCQRSCRVAITPQQFAKPPLPMDPNNPEEVQKYQALEKSLDGTVWKLSIVGADVAKAHKILENNVAYLEKQYAAAESNPGNGENTLGTSTNTNGAGDQPSTNSQTDLPAEVVLPRSIVESVKRRLPFLREKCRSVNITFVPSESKSKQFAKLVIEGSLQSDIDAAKEHTWKQLIQACEENQAPTTAAGVYMDLGFLGGQLSSTDYYRLAEGNNSKNGNNDNTATPSTPVASGSMWDRRQTAKEDLARMSPFFTSFEITQRCTIWVQSDADKGRIDGSNRIVNEATPNGPRKFYFGCEPKAVPKLWELVRQRASEVAQGVKFLHLGPDRLFQPLMMRNGGKFFDFVRRVTGAAVTVDSMTGDHLRIDARGSRPATEAGLPESVTDSERATLAAELIRLQIELYRDHSIRQQSWIFGRDWALARRITTQTAALNDESNNLAVRPIIAPSRSLTFDARSSTNACLEMAQIVSQLGLSGSVAAHASVIFYRFETVLTQPDADESQLKMREVEIACVFLANKSQKMTKWKKLDAVLEAAYKIFYPGVNFEAAKEEVLVWEDKVIAAETEILKALCYDIFWRGFDNVAAAAIEGAKLEPKLAKEALIFSVSGPVLGAGADLWLTYGEEYIYAASAGFLDAKLESLFAALTLIPFKVHQAAEVIVSSMRNTSFGKVHSSHPIFQEGKKGLEERLLRIKEICSSSMGSFVPGFRMDQLSEKEQRYRLLGQQSKQRLEFVGASSSVVKDVVLPALDGIAAESSCSILLEGNKIILEGSWRALAIASSLLKQAVNRSCQLLPVDNSANASTAQNSIQAKGYPGLLQMNKIESADGWAGTIQSTQSYFGRKTGGKSCVAGKMKESDLRAGGLRWWIPPRYGPNPTGAICDMFVVNNTESGPVAALAKLAEAFQGDCAAFSMLSSILAQNGASQMATDRFVAVSLQRWPTDKVAKREKGKEDKSRGLSKKHVWQSGFSAGALQEMQILLRIHGLIKSPQGHPNFMLPIGIGVPSDTGTSNDVSPSPAVGSGTLDLKRIDEDIFSLTRTSLENEVAAANERKRKDMVTGPHLVFQPTPFIFQRFVSRKKKRESGREGISISACVFAAWVHDLLSAILHCHSNDIILRNFQSDQIVVDHSGVAKFGSFYRATVLSKEDKRVDILRAAKERKKEVRGRREDDDEILTNPYAPPEMLLGSPKFTKETDMWTMGCLLCHLLLGKPIYTGKDRQSMLVAAYKLIGTPSTDNYKDGTKFPYYEKPVKKYAPGVVKALSHMLKDENSEKYSGAIDLISQMLQLDPKKRITAKQALQHEFMQSYVENSTTSKFQDDFVKDWITLKDSLLSAGKTEEDDVNERERGIKRKAMLLAASKTMDTGDDDLYDMDDLLGDGEKDSKFPKL